MNIDLGRLEREVRENLIRNLPKGIKATTPSIEMLCDYYDSEEDDWD